MPGLVGSSLLHVAFMFIWYTRLGHTGRIKMRLINFIQKIKPVFTAIALIIMLSACVDLSFPAVNASSQDWQEEFNIANRKLTHTGESKFYPFARISDDIRIPK